MLLPWFGAWVCLLTSPFCCGAALQPSEDFPHSMAMVESDVYHVFWKYDSENITFEVHVRTKGYVGFGISPNGGMVGSDIVIGWVDDQGEVFFHDRYADKRAVPNIDDHQDWELLSGREQEEYTILKFCRKLISCDDQDLDISDGTVRLIWSYHPNDPPGGVVGLTYHGSSRRGTRSVQLLNPAPVEPKLPEDAFYVDLLNNVSLPAKDTTYWCQGFMALHTRELKGIKHHIIKVEPLITHGNEGLVHHMVLYGCYHTPEDGWEKWDNVGHECYLHRMPMDKCSSVIMAWAIGEDGFFFPEHVGYPLGDGIDDPFFMKLEIHYDNPENLTGLRDFSGLRLWLTPTLREMDMGVLDVGIMVNILQLIPPASPDFTSYGHCLPMCIEKALNGSTGFKFIGGILHAHLAGSAMRLRHFRSGTELPLIFEDQYYDFNLQEARLLPEEIEVKATDHLTLECDYNTSKRAKATHGGFSTHEEMCIAFMFYYPKTKMTYCQTVPTFDQSLSLLGLKTIPPWYNPQISTEGEFRGRIAYEVLDELDWNNITIRQEYQEIVRHGEAFLSCDVNGAVSGQILTVVQLPQIDPWVPPEKDCSLDQVSTINQTDVVDDCAEDEVCAGGNRILLNPVIIFTAIIVLCEIQIRN